MTTCHAIRPLLPARADELTLSEVRIRADHVAACTRCAAEAAAYTRLGPLSRLGRGVAGVGGHRRPLDREPPRPALQGAHGHVRRHPVQPGGEGGFVPEAAQLAHHPEVDVLGDVGGVVRVADQPERAGVHAAVRSAHQLLECPAVTGLSGLDELPVDLHLGPLPTFP